MRHCTHWDRSLHQMEICCRPLSRTYIGAGLERHTKAIYQSRDGTASEPLLLPAAASISPRASYCTSYQSSYGSPPGEGAAGVRSTGEIPPGGSDAGRPARHSRRGSTVDDSTLGELSKDGGDEQALINRINNMVRTVPSACPGPKVCPLTPPAKLSAASKAQAALCIITPCEVSLRDWNF